MPEPVSHNLRVESYGRVVNCPPFGIVRARKLPQDQARIVTQEMKAPLATLASNPGCSTLEPTPC